MGYYSRAMHRIGPTIILVIASATISSAAESVLSERARESSVFTFYLENDFFGGTDRHYTNGVKFSWLSRDLTTWGVAGWRRNLVETLPFINRPDAQKNFGIALGQNIYTPENTDLHVPDPTDRPYAGWTYLEFNFVSKTPRVMDTLSFQVGMIGRHSYAQETQKLVHGWLNNEQAKGWAFQLKDEVGVNVMAERRWRLFARSWDNRFGFDIVPHLGVSLGNVQTFANTGATVRVGFNLPSDFGNELIAGGSATNSPLDDRDPRITSRRRGSLFVFGGADGRAVARDIFLDGNTWKDSPSVEKKRVVGESYWGAGVVLARWEITYTYVVRSKEFKAQHDINQFGSVAISRAF
jgi:hypothetical protein